MKYNCVGFHGVTWGTPTQEWRAKTRLSLTTPDGIGISFQWRYFSATKRDTLSPDPDLATTTTRLADREIKAQSFFDLTLTAKIGDHYGFRLGVNNILDREPPIATQLPAGTGSGTLSAGVRRDGPLHLRRRHARLLSRTGQSETERRAFGPPFVFGLRTLKKPMAEAWTWHHASRGGSGGIARRRRRRAADSRRGNRRVARRSEAWLKLAACAVATRHRAALAAISARFASIRSASCRC